MMIINLNYFRIQREEIDLLEREYSLKIQEYQSIEAQITQMVELTYQHTQISYE